MNPENERPPPFHHRVLVSLRDLAIPAPFRTTLREMWERERAEWRDAGDAAARKSEYYRTTCEQRRIAWEAVKWDFTHPFERHPEKLSSFFRRIWYAGKPGNTPPPPIVYRDPDSHFGPAAPLPNVPSEPELRRDIAALEDKMRGMSPRQIWLLKVTDCIPRDAEMHLADMRAMLAIIERRKAEMRNVLDGGPVVL
jgi:hypothetical protein